MNARLSIATLVIVVLLPASSLQAQSNSEDRCGQGDVAWVTTTTGERLEMTNPYVSGTEFVGMGVGEARLPLDAVARIEYPPEDCRIIQEPKVSALETHLSEFLWGALSESFLELMVGVPLGTAAELSGLPGGK